MTTITIKTIQSSKADTGERFRCRIELSAKGRGLQIESDAM